MNIYINAIEVVSEGINNWPQAQAILLGKEDYNAGSIDKYKPNSLPANERRRATNLVRLAFQVCEQIQEKSKLESPASVFASSGGDYQIIDQICRALSKNERLISPTQFHNSVHNSAAGYWGIASHCQSASTSLSAFDYSFSSGLIESTGLLVAEHKQVLFVCYDSVPPVPLRTKRSINTAFACAFLLSREPSDDCIAQFNLGIENSDSLSHCKIKELEALRMDNPAAKCLPLLEACAQPNKTELYFDLACNQKLKLVVEGRA
ncbi:beta-ketoacyl synthase chain length factor [Agaribacterium sp. ZY112]|uniref:beta-ketoacyl synthase chain length factor n=1 Tax=Agaribacterium sp. ZY112 TaxID=3233574 RepID=UPI0035262720